MVLIEMCHTICRHTLPHGQELRVLLTVWQLMSADARKWLVQGIQETADLARGMVPVNLIRAALPHAVDEQHGQLRACLANLN